MPQKHAGNRGDTLGIGDVSKICRVPIHTIRYWEREFCDYLRPSRTVGKQRRYCDDDIRKLLRIRMLLWQQRFSIRGAKRILAAGGAGNEPFLGERPRSPDTRKLLMQLAQFAGGSMVMSESMA